MKPGSGWRARSARADYERHHQGPNMTPMVDVVMVILIFFMASTVIVGPEMLLAAGLESPEEQTPPEEVDARFAIDDPVFEIRIDAGPSGPTVSGLGVDAGSIGDLAGAATRLAADAGTDGVRFVLVPSDEVAYEAVIRVQDRLRDAGFVSIGLR